MKSRSIVPIVAVVLVLVLCPGTGANAQDEQAAASERVIPRGPGEVPARIQADTKPKDVTFDWPGVDNFLKPWTDWKGRVAEEHKFRLGFDYQPVSQWSDNSENEDSAFGGIFRAFTTWDVWGCLLYTSDAADE